MTDPHGTESRPRGGPHFLVMVLCVLAPTIGLLAWVFGSGAARPAYLRSRWVRAGLALLVVGAAPLVAIILAAKLGLWPDPDPNPVGPGLLFFFSGVVATVCLAIGVALVWFDLRRAEGDDGLRHAGEGRGLRLVGSPRAAPAAPDVAAELGCAAAEVREAYARLRANRVLLLEPDGETIRMAPPFSGVPTPTRRRDSRPHVFRQLRLGRARHSRRAAPGGGGALALRAVGRPLRLEVGQAGRPRATGCSTARSRRHAGGRIWSSPEAPCSSSGRKNGCGSGAGRAALPPRPIVRMPQLWELAVTWYATRLEPNARRPGPDEMRGIFARIGLDDPFWDPRADAFG